jgi:hypothetical protein
MTIVIGRQEWSRTDCCMIGPCIIYKYGSVNSVCWFCFMNHFKVENDQELCTYKYWMASSFAKEDDISPWRSVKDMFLQNEISLTILFFMPFCQDTNLLAPIHKSRRGPSQTNIFRLLFYYMYSFNLKIIRCVLIFFNIIVWQKIL